MSYAATANRPNPYAAFGALGIPAGIGVLLVFGLAVQVIMPPEEIGVEGVFVPVEVPEDPPTPTEPVEPTNQTRETVSETQPLAPPPESTVTLTRTTGTLTPIEIVPIGGLGISEPFEIPSPAPTPDPIAAAPRGDPGRWVTDNDYRNLWITRGYAGTASFSLDIDARGRVSNCTITRSTGFDPLDAATCRLIQRRARFEPARDSAGEAVAGSYSSSIRWRIPE